ncbi:MAG: tRNA pseudouridine(55) synthase TruB [Clostridia bacterium]|nr:tRNA pseudouridine(55) synthase TruB [Clostridia bacterium]
MTGIIDLYKEKGMTSHTCVARVRRILGIKKAGHPGTLDPEATGVLPIMVGGATRCSDLFLDMKKSYRATATFGLVSDTQDIWGSVENTGADLSGVTGEAVKEALKEFHGTVMQAPPAYSALKKDGVPYYKLARRGEAVETEARPVNIYSCSLVSFTVNEEGLPAAEIEVCCGRGTYIRTIINDLGVRLGCGAVMSKLERTAYGDFLAGDAVTLSDVEKAAREGRLRDVVRPLKNIFGFPTLELFPGEYTAYMQGKILSADKARVCFPENGPAEDDARIYVNEGETRIMLLTYGQEFALARATLRDENSYELRADRYFGNT